jgi:hypothetical protein
LSLAPDEATIRRRALAVDGKAVPGTRHASVRGCFFRKAFHFQLAVLPLELTQPLTGLLPPRVKTLPEFRIRIGPR